MKMPPHWVEYTANWRRLPMAYWVHVEKDGRHWSEALEYDPPAPLPVPHKGFPVLCVEVGETTLRFSSEPQVKEFLDVMSRQPLPTSRRLSALRGPAGGPNSHWLSRLPAELKSPKGRKMAVAAVASVMAALKAAAVRKKLS